MSDEFYGMADAEYEADYKPAPKEGEKYRPHQEGCICYRCEDWDKAHEPAKVEAGDGLHTRKVAIVTNEAGHKEVKRLVDELKASLLREQKLKELLGEAANAIARHWDITDQAAKDVALKARAAAVKGE